MTNKQRTQNFEPYHVEVQKDGDGFCLVFFADSGNGDRHQLKFHMRSWWVQYIARELWKVIAWRKEEVEQCEKALSSPS